MAKRRETVTPYKQTPLSIRVPAETTRYSRGFYQVEDQQLIVPLCPSGRFYSFLDSPQLSLDIDNAGRLLCLTINTPRQTWRADDSLRFPIGGLSADIRFLEFRDVLPPAEIEVASGTDLIRVGFVRLNQPEFYAVSDNLTVEITGGRFLSAIWIRNIIEDRGARAMAAWRKGMKELLSGTISPKEKPAD